MEPNLEYNDVLVDHLRGQLSIGRRLDAIPDMIKKIIGTGAWQERVNRATGEIVEFKYFRDFVTTPPTNGLGADPKKTERLLADDPEALGMWTEAMTDRPGNPTGANQYSQSGITDNISNSTSNRRNHQHGTSRTSALRRLHTDAPALHAKVIDGELSAHAAMVKAGFRPKTITIPVDPATAARRILTHFTPEQIKELIAELEA